jgi:hypothetical protein
MMQAPYVAPRIESRTEIGSPLVGVIVGSSPPSAGFRRVTPSYEPPAIADRTPIVGALMPVILSGNPPP